MGNTPSQVSPDFELSSREELVTRLVHGEQTWFWSRFTAMSAMHAALFVLLGVESASPAADWARYIVVGTGFVLAAAWVYIQRISLWYVERYKDEYRTVMERAGLLGTRPRYLPLSSTRVGWLTSLAVWLVWAVFLGLGLGAGRTA